ncbi:hypothetical protein RJ55_06716 [Drechmeria coniospora]|nr:hypothetical protein RJ55_06716 [Drechmeria coniospora]
MTAANSTADLVRGDDSIHCEAVCHAEGAHHEDSDDGDAAARQAQSRSRIEAAARRFLNGDVPFLFSALLCGPFDGTSGWSNPWRSKQPTSFGGYASKTHRSLQSEYETQPAENGAEDGVERHFPSPESLKQVALGEAHSLPQKYGRPATVQQWQKTAKPSSSSPSHDAMWETSMTPTSVPARKRRAGDADWLKRATGKKRKVDSGTRSLSKSPLSRRCSNPQLFPVVGQAGTLQDGSAENSDDQDELVASTPRSSFAAYENRVFFTPKRRSPRGDGWRPSKLQANGSEDELNKNQAAAATLSSPVSQPRRTTRMEAGKRDRFPFGGTQTSPIGSRHRAKLVANKASDDDKTEKAEDSDPTLCLEMRQTLDDHADGEVAGFAEEPWPEDDVDATDGSIPATEERDSPGAGPVLVAPSETATDLQSQHDSTPPTLATHGPGEIETHHVSTFAHNSEEPVVGIEGDTSTGILTTKPNDEFSLRRLLHRLVPSSPWATPSLLTAGTTPSTQALDEATTQVAPLERAGDADEPEVKGQVAQKNPAQLEDHGVIARDGSQDGSPEPVVVPSISAAAASACDGEVRITESQQSPWTKMPLQHLLLAPTASQKVDAGDPAHGSLPTEDESHLRIPCQTPRPWSNCADLGAEAEDAAPTPLISTPVPTSRLTTAPSTLEPQFAVQTFAAFMSSSRGHGGGETSRQRKRGTGHPSALKGPWSKSRPNHRVSWALPDDRECKMEGRGETKQQSTPPPRTVRPSSPPPETAVRLLPTTDDAKFGKHFAAVASRTDGLRRRLLPTASQQVRQSPGLRAMAERFLAADEAHDETDHAAGDEDEEMALDQEPAGRELEEPRDEVVDIFDEVGDILQTWDVDAELAQARKATAAAPRTAASFPAQSPW